VLSLPASLPAQNFLSELDELTGLAEGSFELWRTDVDEPVVGRILDVDQLAELAGCLLAAGMICSSRASAS
jgi:hypothetical protein